MVSGGIRNIGLFLACLISALNTDAFEKKLVSLDGGTLSEKVFAVESGRVDQVMEDGKARLMCVAQPNESVRFRLYAPEGF